MRRFVTIVAVAWALYAVLSPNPPLELPPVAPAPEDHEALGPRLPPYVVPIISFNWSRAARGVATGFVVDHDRGLVVTAAHVGVGAWYLIALKGGIWLPATRVRTNFDADVALLAVADGAGPFLPSAATIDSRPPTEGESVRGAGWRIADIFAVREAMFRSEFPEMWVEKTGATLCDVSGGSCNLKVNVLLGWVITRTVPRDDRYALYKDYILLDVGTEGDREIKYGMSGGPIVDRAGHVRGVLVLSVGGTLLAAPAGEVVDLMR